MPEDPPPRRRLTIYTEENIEAFLSGNRRVIDKLLLHGLNNLGAALIDHAEREERIFASMGDAEIIKKRSEWIDLQIDKAKEMSVKTEKRIEMMDKVKTGTAMWAVVAFLGYLSHIAFEASIAWWKARGSQ